MGYRILNVKMNVNDELIMWNDVVAAFFKVLPKHLTEGTKENHKKLSQNNQSSPFAMHGLDLGMF
jgi:uncharacterized protein (UPF0276 family)